MKILLYYFIVTYLSSWSLLDYHMEDFFLPRIKEMPRYFSELIIFSMLILIDYDHLIYQSNLIFVFHQLYITNINLFYKFSLVYILKLYPVSLTKLIITMDVLKDIQGYEFMYFNGLYNMNLYSLQNMVSVSKFSIDHIVINNNIYMFYFLDISYLDVTYMTYISASFWYF